MKSLVETIKERIKNIPLEIENLKYENISILENNSTVTFLDRHNSALIRFANGMKYEHFSVSTIQLNSYLSPMLSSYRKMYCHKYYRENPGNEMNFKFLNSSTLNILKLLNIRIKTRNLGKTILIDGLSLT